MACQKLHVLLNNNKVYNETNSECTSVHKCLSFICEMDMGQKYPNISWKQTSISLAMCFAPSSVMLLNLRSILVTYRLFCNVLYRATMSWSTSRLSVNSWLFPARYRCIFSLNSLFKIQCTWMNSSLHISFWKRFPYQQIQGSTRSIKICHLALGSVVILFIKSWSNSMSICLFVIHNRYFIFQKGIIPWPYIGSLPYSTKCVYETL